MKLSKGKLDSQRTDRERKREREREREIDRGADRINQQKESGCASAGCERND